MMLMVVLILGGLYNTAESVCKSEADLSQEERAVLDKHNEFRALHQKTGPLCYGENGDDVTFGAQGWTDQLAKTGNWAHSPTDLGESIYVGANSKSPTYNWARATVKWYEEIEWWNNDKVCKSTGHYTQIIWRDTQQVNCGFANKGYWAITVCQYYPAGNYEGEYDDQVGPLVKYWRDDGRCGNNHPLPANGQPAKCEKESLTLGCCSANGHCGNSELHCRDWREDLRCGPDWHLAFGEEAKCNPDTSDKAKGHCCSSKGWCGKSDLHCNCEDCIDYSK